jgi:hypothetical protein
MRVIAVRMTITLREQAYDRLADDAREERRSVREQAAYLLERQLLNSPVEQRPAGAERQTEPVR